MTKYYRLIFLFTLLINFKCFSQSPIGQWQDHLSYNNCVDIVAAGSKIFGATDGGAFYFDLTDNSINKLSTVQGLSDVNIAKLAYSSALKTLIIGYVNGNVDFVKDNTIINLNDIERKQIIADKTITSIYLNDDERSAYITTGFGILLLNIEKQEFTETYFLGDKGAPKQVNALEIYNDSIYATTNTGIYKAPASGENLINYANWHKIENMPHANDTFKNIFVFDDKLYAQYYQSKDTDNIYVYDKTSWNLWMTEDEPVINTGTVNDNIFVITSKQIQLFNSVGLLQDTLETVKPQDIIKKDDYYWIGDGFRGIIKYDINTELYGSYPNGPESNKNKRITAHKDKVFVTGGGHDASWVNVWLPGLIYYHVNNRWQSKTDYTLSDVISIAVNPKNPENIFYGSWGYGLYEYDWANREIVNAYNSSNLSDHTLTNIMPYEDEFIRISGLAFDAENNLWVVNSGVGEPISVLKPNGSWISFPYGNVINSETSGDILISRSGLIWIIIPRKGGGIFVLDRGMSIENMQDDTYRRIEIYNEEGEISDNIHSIAEDKNGYMWIGTSKGPFVYYTPDELLETDIAASRIIIPRNDGTSFADILLENEVITAITIDGANRKWFGTSGSGVFLMSEDGITQIHQFNTDNSPLGSNEINDIAINEETGEVFILTKAGIYSYREGAIEGKNEFENVHAFPNPVRENFQGYISITGLVGNVNVKITDISGNLVFETRALGGQAIWDGRNFDGKKVKTGIYLVFCTNEDGTKTQVTKIAFVN